MKRVPVARPQDSAKRSARQLRDRFLRSRVGTAVRASSDRLRRRVATAVLERVAELAERVAQASGVEPLLEARYERPSASRAPAAPTPVETEGTPTAATPAAPPLASHVRKLVDQRLSVLFKNHEFWSSDDPVEAVHDLRVASRRLRAFLNVFRAELDPKARKRTRNPLRTITRGLGPLREWDVHAEQLEARRDQARSDAERAALEHLLETVELRRLKEHRRAVKLTKKLRFREIARLVHASRDDVLRQLELPKLAGPIARDALVSAIDAGIAAIPDLTEEDEERLHDFRITMKKLRYTLEMLEPMVGDRYSEMHAPTKRLQGLIGDHHDRAVLGRIVEAELSSLRSRKRSALVRGLETVKDQLDTERKKYFEQLREDGALPDFEAWRNRAQNLG